MDNLIQRINATVQWKVVAALILVTSLLYLAMIHIAPIPNTMEARNLVAARECVLDGHWLITTMNGKPRLRKPPLPTWTAALSMKAFGTTRSLVAARVPNIGVMALLAFFIYIFARQWLSKAFALTAALAAISSAVMWTTGKRATWDVFTICFAFGGIWLLYKALYRGPSKEGGIRPPEGLKTIITAILLSGLLWGLSFLSKGPVTLYSVLLPFLLALITTGLITGSRKELRWWPIPLILAIALLIGSSWWIVMNVLHPETMKILGQEAQAWHTLHKKGPFFYLSYPLQIFPWTLPLIGSWILLFLKGRDGKKLICGQKRRGLILALLWFVFTIALLSIIPEKKMRYAAVAVMPSSLLVAMLLSVLYESSKKALPTALNFLGSLLTVQLAVVTIIVALAPVYLVLWNGASPLLLIFSIIPVIGYLIIWKSRGTIDTFIAGSFTLVALLALMAAFTDFSYLKPGSAHDANGAARVAELTENKDFYLFQQGEMVLWALGRKVELLENKESSNFPFYLLVEAPRQDAFRSWAFARDLSHKEISRFAYGHQGKIYILMKLDRGKSD